MNLPKRNSGCTFSGVHPLYCSDAAEVAPLLFDGLVIHQHIYAERGIQSLLNAQGEEGVYSSE